LSDCVVRIETGLWVIRFHYVAYVQNVVKYLTTDVDHAKTVHGRGLPWALPTGVGTAHWALGTSNAQFTVYRLRHSITNQDRCPTARTAARPIPEGMTIFCLLTASTSQIRTA